MSFRIKLTMTILLLISIAFGLGSSLLITASFNSSLETEKEKAFESYESVRTTLYLLNILNDQTDNGSLHDVLTQMVDQGITKWQALTLTIDDEVIYQSGSADLLAYDLPVPSNELCAYAELNDQFGRGIQILSTLSSEDEQFILEARFDLSSVYETRDIQLQLFRGIFTVVVLVGIIISAVLSIYLTKRLKKLTSAVRRITDGALDTRSEIKSSDEFGQLSRDFDTMADSLQNSMHKLHDDIQRQEAFIGAFAHELKTPMTSIIGYADLLRQDCLDESGRRLAADYIFSEGKRLEKLSFKLLDLIVLKEDSFEMKEVLLSQFMQEITDILSPILSGKSIRLIVRGERRKVCFEPDLVKSLLYNLADNAVKSIDGEGIITVKGSAIDGGCSFQIEDNGCGMPKEELDRITDAFYRVDKSRSRKQGGAGLGLALCRKITALHNGNIHFESTPGAGTRVTVTLFGKAGS